jgi:hypothetical protein
VWGRPPFYIPDSFTVEIRNLDTGRTWYKEKLGLRDAPTGREDDSGRPFADLQFSDGTFVTLVEAEPGSPIPHPRRYDAFDPKPMIFARNLQKAHDWLANRGVAVGAITADSGGNQLFQFDDLDGNSIEVCKET